MPTTDAPILTATRRRSSTRRAAAVEIVSASSLAKHLGISRQYISRIADDGVIERLPNGGFDQDRSRLKYLAWLRDPARRAARSEAQSEYGKMKSRLLQLRIAEAEGRLMEVTEMEVLIDEMCGLFRMGLGGMGARVTRDLTIRRAIDAACFDILTGIANAANERAKEWEKRKA